MIGNKYLNPEDIKFIVIHCSDTNEQDDALSIHKLHLSFGWDGIGYHKVILQNGKIENGRPEYWPGAHVLGYNNMSIGVCLIGRNHFTDKQFRSLKKLILEWKIKYKKAKIVGHNNFEYTTKTCPNFNVIDWCKNENIL